MKVLVVVLSVLALSQAQVQVRLPFLNSAGVTFTGAGYGNPYTAQPNLAQQQQQEQPQQQQPEGQTQEQPQPIEAQPIAEQPAEAAPEQQQQQQPAVVPQFYSAQQQQQQVYQAQAPAPAYAAASPFPAAYYQYQHAAQQPQYQYAAYNPAAVQYAAQPAAVQYAAQPAAVQYAAPALAPVAQFHRAVVPQLQYAQPAYQAVKYAQPAVAVHQKIGYASTPVLTKVQGHADLPITKLAYTQGYTQKEIDVAHPAVSTRKIKVRRPALRKEFYDIEHRVIVRPAGSATLELSQPISKEQQGPAVLTKTKFAHLAPVVRYGASRRIIDGEGSTGFASLRAVPAPGAPLAAAPAPIPQARSAAPAPAPQPQQAQARQAIDQDTEVIEAARDDRPAEQQQPQAEEPQQPQPEQPQEQQPDAPTPVAPAAPAPAPLPDQGRGLTITPDMPAELQSRLLELLTAKGGTVTEILNKDGTPADSASVLQVADALGDPSLQGGERITTRRIVVTRPIETIQEIEVQEPATKIQRQLFQQPTLFKHHVPAVARVPVAIPAVKHVATPFVKTTYATAPQAAYSFNYAAPHFSYSH